VLSREDLLLSTLDYFTTFLDLWICNKKALIFHDTRDIVMHRNDKNIILVDILSVISNTWQELPKDNYFLVQATID